MASAPGAKSRKGSQKMLPCYIGVTSEKDATGKKRSVTHYVLINDRVAPRLGLKGVVKKPGGSDTVEFGIVYKLNRRKPKQKGAGSVESKRYITYYKRKITVYCKAFVKNKQGKDVRESYTLNFPSGLPLSSIRKFLQNNCKNVIRYGTGSQLYQVR
jgi:hypothetical protein